MKSEKKNKLKNKHNTNDITISKDNLSSQKSQNGHNLEKVKNETASLDSTPPGRGTQSYKIDVNN